MTVRNLGVLIAVLWAVGSGIAVAQDAPISIIATLTAAPGKEAELKAALVPLAASSRTEAGCTSYTLLENNAKPGQFFTYETWTSKAAIEAHMKGPGIALVSKKLQGVLDGPPSQTFLTKVP